MKTITTSRKARNIATKTVQCIPLLLNNSAMKKQLATLFFCLLIGIQAKSINVQIAKVDDACAEGIGSISAFVSGGIAPYTFVWSNGTTNISNDTEDTLHNLFSGSYSLTVYDSNGDSAIGNATLINYATLGRNGLLTGTFITSHGPPPSGVSGYACPNKNDGIVYGLLNIIGGSAPFTISNFSVTNLATGLNSTSAFAYTATGSLGEYFAIDSLMYADQFQLTITDSAGCPGYFSDYEIGPHYYSQVVVNTTPSTNGQNNGSINLSNYLYYWPSGFYISISDGAGFQYINPTAFGSENISNALSAGTYTVYMRFNDTRNNCDTLYNITVSNTNEYYWVGGNGDWNDINHWSNVSGGAPFYSVPPTAADDVFFDTNSPLGGSCVVRFASIFIAECRNISVVGFPVFSDFNSPTDFNISGSADFGGALFQFASVIHFMANTSVNLIFPPDLNETRIELNSANGSGAFNLAGNLKATIVTLLSGTFNTNGYTVEVENFSTSFTALPRAINLSNSQIFIDDIPGVGTNNFAWNSDSNVVVNAQNASFTSSTPFSGLAIRNTAIKSLTFNNSSGFAFRNVHITSLHNTQSGSFNLHVTGSGYLSIDTIISTATGINNNSALPCWVSRAIRLPE